MSLNLHEIKAEAEFILNKDQKGDPVKPETYQILLKVIGEEFFNFELQKMLSRSNIENKELETYLITDSALFKFKKIWQSFILADAFTVQLPTDFKRHVSLSVRIDNKMLSCEIVDEDEYDKRISSVVGKSIVSYPIATIIGNLIRAVPNDFSGMKFTYLRKPLVPFYDYCVNSVDEIVFMPENSVIKTEAGKEMLYDFNDFLLAEDVTHLDTPTIPYTSQTVEFEYDDRFIPMIIDLLVEKLGAKSREVLISKKN